ncbi:hypothetical protein [Methylorubrum sp. GM97]|uniref:hypothetical protein n=1 Tax=Methylorubrum sp. GM97 TaxID=2938232 RepID=UPI0021C33CEE|nr:hypothetical protein [Methylorubrum sp. GM97]
MNARVTLWSLCSGIALVPLGSGCTGNTWDAGFALRPLRTWGADIAARAALALSAGRAVGSRRTGGPRLTLLPGRTLHGPHAVADGPGFGRDRRGEREAKREAEKRAHQPPPMP